eukprot:8087854-Lingulodinium_polyedra.AAC.1
MAARPAPTGSRTQYIKGICCQPRLPCRAGRHLCPLGSWASARIILVWMSKPGAEEVPGYGPFFG